MVLICIGFWLNLSQRPLAMVNRAARGLGEEVVCVFVV